MKVKINKLNLVGSWNWNLGENNNCTICMNPYECPCPGCKIPGDDCPPIEGSCGKWLDSGNDKCPLDRNPWVEKVGSVINNRNNSNIRNNNNYDNNDNNNQNSS